MKTTILFFFLISSTCYGQTRLDSLEYTVGVHSEDIKYLSELIKDVERNTRIDFYWVGKDLLSVSHKMDSMAKKRPKDYGWLTAVSQGITAAALKMMGL
jgi:hypothetical protein